MILSDNFIGKRPGALLGFISVVGCTLLALALMPEDPSPEGALAVPAFAVSVGILLIPALRLFFGGRLVLRPENFVALGIVYWLLLDLLQGAYPLYSVSAEGARSALLGVAFFAAMMWLGALGDPWRLPQFITKASQRPLDNWLVWKIFLLCFVLGMAPFVIAVNFNIPDMFSYLGEGRWAAPWTRGQLGGWDSFLDQLQYFGYLLPCLAVFLAIRRGWLRIDVWLAFSLAFLDLLFLSSTGGRRIIGVTVGAAIICWLLTRPQLKARSLAAMAVATAVLLGAMQFILEIRSVGYETYSQFGRQFEYLHVDDNILRFAQVVDIVPKEQDFVYFKQIFYVLVRPIPRVFWEGKPTDPGFDLPSMVGQEGTSLSTSIIGEWYLVFGWVAVAFGGWFHGKLASAVGGLIGTAKQASDNPIVYSISVMVLVAGLRSMQDLVVMSYAVLSWYAVTWLIPKRSIVVGKLGRTKS